jgi:sec-independent protein translocase protein TatB
MEMLVVGIVALIVIGPKDLPGLFRQVGQFVGKAKGMAREFSSAMNAAADESGINEINKTIKAAANPKKFGIDKIREASQGAVKSTLKTALVGVSIRRGALGRGASLRPRKSPVAVRRDLAS